MNKYLTYLLATFCFLSCNEKKLNQISSETSTDTIRTESFEMTEQDFGFWVGLFEADSADYQQSENFSYQNKIGLVIQKIEGESIKGYTINAGNMRPFSGKVTNTDSTKYAVVSEPGDFKYDGTYQFHISPNNDSIYGSWISKRKDMPVYSRTYNLKKSIFKYDPNLMLTQRFNEDMDGQLVGEILIDWVNYKEEKEKIDGEEYGMAVHRSTSDAVYKLNASTEKLTEKQLKNLRKIDLEVLRNTIYARHGYSFSNKGVRQFFDLVEWYTPLFINVEDKLTPLEKENIKLISRLEKYAEDFYQQYGR